MRGLAWLTRRGIHPDPSSQNTGTVRAGQWKTKVISLSERATALLKGCELLRRFHAFRDDLHVQILTHANQRANDIGIFRIRGDAVHEGPINLERIDRKASEMAQARITGAEVVEGERQAQLLEIAKYACRIGGLLHQEGLGQLEL